MSMATSTDAQPPALHVADRHDLIRVHGARENNLKNVSIEIPKPLPELIRFYKVAKRRVDDISTVAAAMALDREGAGRVSRARLAFGGVAATPVRLVEAEASAAGQAWNEAAVERVQQVIGRTLTPMSDHRGSASYRLEVSKSLVEKFWWESRS